MRHVIHLFFFLVLSLVPGFSNTTYADGPVDAWSTEIRVLEDESVIITEELSVQFHKGGGVPEA
jgi:hypothetical protein